MNISSRTAACLTTALACLVPAGSAHAQTCSYADDYPYPAKSYLSVDPWYFYYRECTSYVAWCMNRDHGTPTSPYWFNNVMMGGRWGNAENWSDNAQDLGFPVSSMPGAGAIAHYNVTESPPYGHVAYVRNVNSDGSVNLQEYNWGCSHCYNVRCSVRPPRFIYLNSAPPPLKFALGDTVQVTGLSPSTLSIRSPNACDAVIAQKTDGSIGQIISATMVRCGSGSSYYNRWQIRWSDGVTGWAAEDWLIRITPPNCTYSIAPTSLVASWLGTSGAFDVTTLNGCQWTATPSGSWITITSGGSGFISGTVSFTVDPNHAKLARSGNISVQGRTYTISQSRAIPGDFDFNNHVEDPDFIHFNNCLKGADVSPPASGCTDADLDDDNDVDQSDFAIFQRCLTGPAVAGNPNCGS